MQTSPAGNSLQTGFRPEIRSSSPREASEPSSTMEASGSKCPATQAKRRTQQVPGMYSLPPIWYDTPEPKTPLTSALFAACAASLKVEATGGGDGVPHRPQVEAEASPTPNFQSDI